MKCTIDPGCSCECEACVMGTGCLRAAWGVSNSHGWSDEKAARAEDATHDPDGGQE